jgi:SAM-dependent methyltransferase
MSEEVTNLNLRRLYPEIGAGGYSRFDGSVEFYSRINALLSPSMTVLDYGAGRGAQLERNTSPYRTSLCKLKGKVQKLVGVDIDDAVLSNPYMDEARQISPNEALPFEDSTFDLIYADWVLEHVDHPEHFVNEVHRLLKPGGWFCARTPNRWGMIGIGTNLIPNSLHTRILRVLQPSRKDIDVFPTVYRMNTLRKISHYFPVSDWNNFSYITNSEPPYVQRSILAMRAVQFVWRFLPPSLGTVLNVFTQKR